MSEIKHTPGPWEVDAIDNCGEYGDGGPDTSTGFKSYAVYDAKGRVLFDTLNSDAAEIHDEGHDLDHHAWDEVGKRNLTLAQAAPDMAMVLEMLASEADAGTVMIPSGLRLTIDAALIKAGRKAAPVREKPCETCGGRGEVGGWRQGDGYGTDPCPDCSANSSKDAPEPVRHVTIAGGAQ